MVRRRRSGSAFWLFLLVLALGAGWAAYQEWHWPHLALFDQGDETDGQVAAPAVAEQSAAEQAEAKELVVDSGIEETVPTAGPQAALQDPPEAETSDAAPPSGQEVAEDAAAPVPAAGPEAAERDTGDPVPEPGTEPEAEIAATQADVEPAQEAALESGEAESALPAEVAATDPTSEQPAQEPAPELPAVAETEDHAETSVAATDGPLSSPETDLDREPETEVEATPRFDIVRVGRDGRAVIAGRAAPGAEVEVRSGGQVIDRVQATRRGEWVAIPARPLAPGDQELSAVATRAGAAVESEQVVVVAVPEPTSPTAATETVAPVEPVAVLLPRQGRGTGRILQAPGRISAEGTLALMTVSYDDSGKVLLSGEAPPGAPVRIYVDNRPAALVVGDAKGDWSSGLGETLAPGTYSLRLDQLDADGRTVARIETPFTRVSEPPVEGNLQVDYVMVQPGNSLWRIARRLSGKGLDYVHIYDANQAQIRDPDLIYPGQVFEVPTGFGSSG